MNNPAASHVRLLLKALVQRFPGPVAFVRARLNRGSYLGLQLTAGAVVLIGALWLFAGIAEDVVTGDPLTLVDEWIARWLHRHATPGFTRVMLLVSRLHNPAPISAFTLLLALVLLWKRNWCWLLTVALAVPGGMLLNTLTKLLFRRGRPEFDHPFLTLTTYSFPSGHVAGATLLYGVMAAMLWRERPHGASGWVLGWHFSRWSGWSP
ncbi:MAG: phosphatase PAP2 family protein [Pseudomonadota bacterium]